LINVHLNGDVVRCPDISVIQKRSWEIKDTHNICRYNIHECDCEVWKQSVTAWQKFNDIVPRCMFSGSEMCPGHRQRNELGKQDKKFHIDNTTYRKLASTAHYLVKESKSKTLFLTLTFPKFKKKPSYNEINSCFSKFMENLRTNYNCQGYIAVREFGKSTHRVHFHLLCAIPFVPFVKLNAAWCHSISDISEFAVNAVTTDPKTRFVKDPVRAMRYVCKYFSKCKGQTSFTRLVFISNNIIQQPKKIVGERIEDILKGYKGIYINQTSDYSTCYRITDNDSFNKFCIDFLYPLFELSVQKFKPLYAFPVNSS
jgi:hypothetical protein